MTTMEELDRRVSALELARVAAVQDEHTLHLERLSSDVGKVGAKIDGLAGNLPAMLADAVRDGLKPR